MKKKPYNIITCIQNMVLGEFNAVTGLPLAQPLGRSAASKLKISVFPLKLLYK